MRKLLMALWVAGPLTVLAASPQTVTLVVQNMTCELCPITVKKSLEKVPGVRGPGSLMAASLRRCTPIPTSTKDSTPRAPPPPTSTASATSSPGAPSAGGSSTTSRRSARTAATLMRNPCLQTPASSSTSARAVRCCCTRSRAIVVSSARSARCHAHRSSSSVGAAQGHRSCDIGQAYPD